ncbi:hypothetical protein RB595_004230 [Gaeumannomyces hyphopodioides]
MGDKRQERTVLGAPRRPRRPRSNALVYAAICLRGQAKGNFTLYAYGGGLGGEKLCAKDGLAYLVDTKKVNASAHGVAPVWFTVSGTSWLASTNGTGNGTRLDMARFFVPAPGAPSKNVGFLAKDAEPASTDGAITEGFDFYGKLALHVDQQTGKLQTSFYAKPTGVDGVSALVWNDTVSDGGKSVVTELRTVPPTTGESL